MAPTILREEVIAALADCPCTEALLSDTVCTEECNVVACLWDLGACLDSEGGAQVASG
jgi:hypothetical protein